MTIGGCSARIVPSSGTVIWKSASTSSRKASKASSVRSSSSMSSTGAPAGSGSSACRSGRSDEVAVGEQVALELRPVDRAARLGEADRHHLPGIVPLVDGGGDVEALVALQADQAPPERGGEDLGDLGLADPRLAFQEQRPPELQGEEQHRRQRPVGDVAGAFQEVEGVVDGSRGADLPRHRQVDARGISRRDGRSRPPSGERSRARGPPLQGRPAPSGSGITPLRVHGSPPGSADGCRHPSPPSPQGRDQPATARRRPGRRGGP